MPSSYTPSLRLVLPVQGELTGTWGNTVNSGLTSLVDAAIAGTATVSMPNSDYTLTAVNEAADEARQMFIRLTGTLSAQRNVVCPAVSKLYFVSNETTGGFGINFKTAAGTGVVVPNGARMMLYCNGTNVVEGITLFNGNAGTVTNGVYTTGDQTIDGTKNFSTAPVVGTASEKTANTSAASTAFVDRLRSLSTPTTVASGTLAIGDRGSLVSATGGVTIPANVFAARDVVTLYNNSVSSITLTQGSGLTLRAAGTANTGNRTLAQSGIATVTFVSATEAVISGAGMT